MIELEKNEVRENEPIRWMSLWLKWRSQPRVEWHLFILKFSSKYSKPDLFR